MAIFYLLGRTSDRWLPDEYIAAAGELSIGPSPAAKHPAYLGAIKKEMTRGGFLF
jgi:hypothetical protein